MRNLLKGALLNALVFPGTGQLAQRKKLRGWVYIVLAFTCLIILMRVIVNQLAQVTDLVSTSNAPVDTAELTTIVTENMAASGGMAPFAVGALALIWLVALIDAVITGLQTDRAGQG